MIVGILIGYVLGVISLMCLRVFLYRTNKLVEKLKDEKNG